MSRRREWLSLLGVLLGASLAAYYFVVQTYDSANHAVNFWPFWWLAWLAGGFVVVGVAWLWVFFRRGSRGRTPAATDGPDSRADETPGPEPFHPVPLRQYFAEMARDNPRATIIKAYIEIERWFDGLVRANGLDYYEGVHRLGVNELLVLAVDRGLLPSKMANAIGPLSTIRDRAVMSDDADFSSTDARAYLTDVDEVLSECLAASSALGAKPPSHDDFLLG